MFDIGATEILVIAVVTILVVGPKELPGLLRGMGKTIGQARRMANDVQRQFNDALKEADLGDVAKTIGDVRSLDPRRQLRDAILSEPKAAPRTAPKPAAMPTPRPGASSGPSHVAGPIVAEPVKTGASDAPAGLLAPAAGEAAPCVPQEEGQK